MATDRKQPASEVSGPVHPDALIAAGEQVPAVPKQPSGIRRARALTPDVDENKRGELEIETASTRGPGGWLWSPANLELMVLGEKRLIKVARALGAAVNRVDKVRAARPKGTKLVFVTPTDDEDPDGIPVGRRGAHAWINLVELLSPLKLTVPMGQKQFFRVEFAGEAIAEAAYQGTPCPYEASIVFNIDKVVETAVVPKKEKKKGSKKTPNGPDNQGNAGGNKDPENQPETGADQPAAEAGGPGAAGTAGDPLHGAERKPEGTS